EQLEEAEEAEEREAGGEVGEGQEGEGEAHRRDDAKFRIYARQQADQGADDEQGSGPESVERYQPRRRRHATGAIRAGRRGSTRPLRQSWTRRPCRRSGTGLCSGAE